VAGATGQWLERQDSDAGRARIAAPSGMTLILPDPCLDLPHNLIETGDNSAQTNSPP
jgi:hypothetical protein